MLGRSLHRVPPGHFWSSGTSFFLLRGAQRSIVYVVFVKLAEFSTLWSTDLGPPNDLKFQPAPSARACSQLKTFAEARKGKMKVDRIAASTGLRGNRMIQGLKRTTKRKLLKKASCPGRRGTSEGVCGRERMKERGFTVVCRCDVDCVAHKSLLVGMTNSQLRQKVWLRHQC